MGNELASDPATTDAFACTACGCVCDDLRITVAGGRIRQTSGACSLAEPWLLGQEGAGEIALVDESTVSLDQAMSHAAQILRSARAPLIFGLTGCGTEGQRAAIALADRIGANIDTAAAKLPLLLAMQEVGLSTCTLGEVRQRADLVVIWGADPMVWQPRLLERSVFAAASDPLEAGRTVMDRARRTVIVIDGQRTATAELADRFLSIEAGRHFETLWALRGLVRDPPLSASSAGMPAADLDQLARLMKQCRFGVVFFGPGLSREGPRTVEALLRLVADLNEPKRRFYALDLPGEGPGGADNVLAWQTGFAAAVNFAHGYPRSNPGEFSAEKLLEEEATDACLVVGALPHLSSKALAHLGRLPTIVIAPPGPEILPSARVRIITARPGIHVSGTAYRLDGVAIPLKAVLPVSYPHMATVLHGISERIAAVG